MGYSFKYRGIYKVRGEGYMGLVLRNNEDVEKVKNVKASDSDISDILKYVNAGKPNDKKFGRHGRRYNVAVIGCQLGCFTVGDLLYIFNQNTDMGEVERFFRDRKFK